jgi:nucleotide-binding universal stress UspA family protein
MRFNETCHTTEQGCIMRILLAIDESAHSQTAVDFLITQPFSVPIDLDIVSVIVPLPYVDDGGMIGMGIDTIPDLGHLVAEDRERLELKLADTSAKLQGRFNSISTIVKFGTPGPEITAVAESGGTDLVVMGAVGHSAISRMLLGSVSDYVATHVKCSTLVIRPHDEAGSYAIPERILLAVGVSEHDDRLIDELQSFDLSVSTEIHLVHVMQMMTFFGQDLRERTSAVWQQTQAEALRHLHALEVRAKEMGYTVKIRMLEEAHIGEAILKYMEQEKCQLVLTCDLRRSVLDRVFLGSTSRYLLRHSASSVLIVRANSQASD